MYSRVYLEITNVCNKSCSFCHPTKRAPKFMTVEEFDFITNKLSGITEYIYLHIMGEPLMHPEVEKLISIATKKGFKVAITTNGTLLDKKGDAIINSGVYKVNISLHSFENASHEEHLSYIDTCISFAEKSQNSGVLTVFRLWNNGFEDEKNNVALNYLKSKISGEWQNGNRGVRIKKRLHLEYGERFIWPDINLPEISKNVFCYGLRDHFGILSDGSVVPCCLDSDGVINLGNVFKEPLKDILNTKRAKNIYNGFTARNACEELCKRCGYAQRFNK